MAIWRNFATNFSLEMLRNVSERLKCTHTHTHIAGPWASEVAGIVKIGQTMTMVLAIKDEENKFDMLVRNCFAHDGKRGPIELVDKTGCITRPKLMSRFTKIKNFGSSATVLSYAHFQAFKFPDSMEVHFQCTIQICRHQCPDQCSANSGQQSSDTYTESTIHGTMNIHGRSGDQQASGSADSVHLRKFGQSSGGASLSRERRDLSSLRRSHRHANESALAADQQLNKMIGVNRVIQVVSSGDLAFSISNGLNQQSQQQIINGSLINGAGEQAAALVDQLDAVTQQICISSYSFVLALVILCLLLLSSCLAAITLYWKQQVMNRSGEGLANNNNKQLGLYSAGSSPSPSLTTTNSKTLLRHQNSHHHHHQEHY